MVKDANLTMSSPGARSSQESDGPLLGTGNNKKNYGDQSYWPRLASKDKIPVWLRDNDYIINGHPMPTESYRKSFRLWRCLHMETMNIWTHSLGSAAFVATGIALLRHVGTSSVQQATLGDKIAFGTLLTAATVCFGLSTTFHTLRSHSYNVHHLWGKMDILGICVLALGGGISATYYALHKNPMLQRVYWSLDALSAVGAAMTLFDTGGGGTRMRTLRGGVFSLLAVSTMLPVLHSIQLLGWSQACTEIGAHYFLSEGLWLCLGVVLFVSRIPERLKPGFFDVWGHSHQLFHSCAVIATFFHIAALVTGYKYWHSGQR